MMHGYSEQTMIPQSASNTNCDKTRRTAPPQSPGSLRGDGAVYDPDDWSHPSRTPPWIV